MDPKDAVESVANNVEETTEGRQKVCEEDHHDVRKKVFQENVNKRVLLEWVRITGLENKNKWKYDRLLAHLANVITGARLLPFDATMFSERTVKELRYAEFSLNFLSNRASTQPELLISTGDVVFVWRKHWEKMENNLMRIPERTVLLVERATTYKLVDNKGLETVAVDGLIRILDAAVLNGDDVTGLLYSKRMAAAQKFCQALKLIVSKVRLGWGNRERYVVPPQLIVAGVYSFDQLAQGANKFKVIAEAWKMGWSCSRSMKYAFCPQRPEHSYFGPQWEEHECCSSFWESAMPSKKTSKHVPMQCIWSWENSLLDNYGPRVILENDSHKSGATVNSVLREVAETDEQCGKSVAA